MLGPDNELILVSRVLKVVDNVRDDDGEDVELSECLLQVADRE